MSVRGRREVRVSQWAGVHIYKNLPANTELGPFNLAKPFSIKLPALNWLDNCSRGWRQKFQYSRIDVLSREGICSHENRRSPSSGLALATGRSFSDGNGRVFTEKYNFQDISVHLMMTLSMAIWRVMSTTTRNSQQGPTGDNIQFSG